MPCASLAHQWFQPLFFLYRNTSIKHRYYPTLGFGEFDAAQRFCRAVDEVGNFLRPRSRMAEVVSLAECRERFMKGVEELEAIFKVA